MTETALDERWVRRFHPGPDGAAQLVCFPHAGGSASYFRPLSAALSATARVLALQYPGRQDRLHEPGLSSIAEFADEAYAALTPLRAGPIALFGHSMGAMIAFEVATRMRERGDASPVALFVSGRRAPSRHRDESVHLLDDHGLAAELRRLSGTDARILDDESVLRMILPPTRSDYTAVETYRYRPGPKLDCPVIALTGDEDLRVDLDDARAWAAHTTGPFALHTFSGGHFYLVEHQAAIVDIIAERLASHPK